MNKLESEKWKKEKKVKKRIQESETREENKKEIREQYGNEKRWDKQKIMYDKDLKMTEKIKC